LSRGARSGEWEQTFVAPNGDEYIAKFDLDPTSRERLTIITPEGKAVKKISDIRDILKYPEYSVEEFIRWGDTAEGRKKQGNVLFKMLPQDIQDKYTHLALDEKQLFDDRTYKGRMLKEKQGALKTQKLSDSDIQEAMLYAEYQNQEQSILDSMGGYEELKEEAQRVSDEMTKASVSLESVREKIIDKGNAFKSVEEEVRQLEEQLMRKRQQLTDIKNEGRELRSQEDKLTATVKGLREKVVSLNEEKKQYAEQEDKLKAIREKQGECLEIKLRVDNYEKLEEEVAHLEAEHKALDKKVTEVRNARRRLIEEAELPVKDLTIEDGELYVRKGNELFKFSEEEMCTSELLVKGIEIALAANPTTKILFLFNANLLNTEKRDALDKLAKHLDYLFLLELVDETAPNIHLVAHEEYGK